MQKKLLKAILKSKIQKNKTTDELIDEFISQQGANGKDKLESYLSELLVYIFKSLDKYDDATVLSLVESKLKSLNIEFETKEIENIYESIALSAAVGNTALVFNKIDLDTITTMKKSFFWTGKEYNEKTSDKLKSVIESAFNGEVPRADLGAKLKEEFNGIIDADERYFKGVADHIISQSQNISRVNQALKYDVKHFKVRARIDNKTSVVCRSMHGRIIDASHLEAQIIEILNAKDIGQKKGAAIWSSKPIFGKLAKNFGLPPYHFRCRTGVEPVWLDKDTILDESNRQIMPLDKETDKKITTKEGHLKSTKYKSAKEMLLETVQNISMEGYHLNDSTKKVIFGQNGCIAFIDKNGNCESCFKPKIGVEYYEKWAITLYDSIKEKGLKKWLEILTLR